MSEIEILGINAVVLMIAYFYIYPRFGGDNVNRIAWLDVAIGLTALAILAPFNWGSADEFTLLPNWDTSWWIFAILTYALIEIPLFAIYCTRRGLWGVYFEGARESFSDVAFSSTASTKSVQKQLSDTKWDWMRKPKFMRNLVIATNLWMFSATIFLINVGDNKWASLVILHIAVLFIFWFMLRTSVRLIAEARDEALDERMIADRNRSYFKAYQLLSGVATLLLAALLAYIVSQGMSSDDGFTYQLNATWPQLQALFWFVWGYAFMSPSMVMAWRESKSG